MYSFKRDRPIAVAVTVKSGFEVPKQVCAGSDGVCPMAVCTDMRVSE